MRVLDLDKKKKIKGLSSQRADILPAALAVVKAFTSYMKFETFTIGGSGLREGIMFNQALPITLEKPVSDVLSYSLETLVRYYDCDPKHVEHVVHLSIQLFKQLLCQTFRIAPSLSFHILCLKWSFTYETPAYGRCFLRRSTHPAGRAYLFHKMQIL